MAGDRFVVVGAGLAGVRAAEALRDEGYTGSLVVLDREQTLPYDRPPLSKGALKGEEEYDAATLHPAQWYADRDIDLRLGVDVARVDRSRHTVELGLGDPLSYDRLLLATGSRVRTVSVPGGDADGVHYLRTMDDSQRLLKRLRDHPRVVVVGGGWIGLEVAAAARGHGCPVTVVEPQPTPLFGVLGPEVGGFYGDLHVANGVDLRLGDGVLGIASDAGHVSGVVTTNGDRVPADLVVVGVGVLPNTELASETGLDVDNGVLCDASLRTSDPDVFAVGGIAHWEHPLLGHRVRVEHWANAHDGGATAGRAMLGRDVVHDAVPFFYSDQYDTGMEYAGYVPRGLDTTVVTRGDPAAHEFMAFWLHDDGRILAGMHVNVWDTIDAVQDLIRSGARPDVGRLRDTGVPLAEVAG
jgi:3-phenylpropionate/trans-cinnamate dioxygenase ferredoxin reductase component